MLYAPGWSMPGSDPLRQRRRAFVVAARWDHREEWSRPDTFLQYVVVGHSLTGHELSWRRWVWPLAHTK